MKILSKKRAKWLFLPTMLLCVVLVIAGCGGGSDDQGTADADDSGSSDSDAIHAVIGYWGGGVCEMPIYVAYEYGFFEKNGIDPELYTITDDLSVVLASGAIDCVETQPGDLVAIIEGSPLTLVDTLHTGCYSVACMEDSGFTSLADLEGKTVATSGFTGSGYITMYYEMLQLGADPDSVNWVIYSDSTSEYAMEQGEVDAILVHDPYAQLAQADGHTLLWEQATGIVGDYCCCFLGMYTPSLEANPEMAERLCKAFEEALEYAQNNVEEVTEMALEKGYLAGNDAVQLQNTETYLFDGGDEDWFDTSISANWDMEYACGNLPDAPNPDEDPDGYADYIADLTASMSKYMGSTK